MREFNCTLKEMLGVFELPLRGWLRYAPKCVVSAYAEAQHKYVVWRYGPRPNMDEFIFGPLEAPKGPPKCTSCGATVGSCTHGSLVTGEPAGKLSD